MSDVKLAFELAGWVLAFYGGLYWAVYIIVRAYCNARVKTQFKTVQTVNLNSKAPETNHEK